MLRNHPGWCGIVAACGLGLAAWAQTPRPGVAAPPKALQSGAGVTAGAAAAPARVNDPPKAATVDPEYVIGPGDVLAIDVYHEPEDSRTLPVRPDGRISLPLAGELVAEGKTAVQLQDEISTRLEKYIDAPSVTVMVQDAESHRFNILGMVKAPGSFALTHPTTILDAIAMAGGLLDFAHQKNIYLIRRRATDGVEIRYNFNYNAVSRGLNMQQNVLIQPNDTIVVP